MKVAQAAESAIRSASAERFDRCRYNGRILRDFARSPCGPTGTCDQGVEGIGASVVRKEDSNFVTGKGRYVDDIKLLGMTHAHFVRSPHAHAKVKGIESLGRDEDAGHRREC